MTVAQALDAAADADGDRPLVITDERAYTYAEVQEWSRRLAAGMVELGIRPGDHVALVMANYPDFVALKFAIARAGAVCVPINYLFRAPELGYVLRQSDAKLLITMERYRDLHHLDALDELAPGWETNAGSDAIPNLKQVVVFSPSGAGREGAMTLAQLEALGTDEARAEVARRESSGDPQAASDILYTSGTTGSPKGVLLTHQHVLRMAYAAAYHRALDDGRRSCFPLPMYHVFGYVECLMAALYVGGAIVPRVVFDAEDMLTAIARHRVNEIVAVPAVTLPLLAEARGGAYDLSSVTTVFSSGGVVSKTIWDEIREVFGDVEITTGYGMTETTAATTCALPEEGDDRLRATLGRLRLAGAAGDPDLGGHLAIYKAVDLETGEDLPPGEQGHLLVRGPVVTPGYYNKPEETKAAFTSDGWLLTGDIGSIDGDGYLRLTGRLKESYRCGGEMVMPREVETVLEQHPEVAAAHVVGVRHARMGEIGCAWVIARDAAHPPDAEELIEHCKRRLARFKVPWHIMYTSAEALPVTATGRVQKFRLTELAERRLTEQPAPA
jgi:fatty-acyl-CoA synthase